jgi:hypothetical protein
MTAKSKSEIIDFSLNVFIASFSILLKEFGNLSAIGFIFLIFYNLEGKRNFFIFGSYLFVVLSVSAFNQNIDPLKTALYIGGYIYLILKFYWKIYQPSQNLKTENQTLKNRLSIIGDAKHLTDDQILQKYNFMNHTKSNPYTKIQILRNLADGETSKTMEIKNDENENISYRTIDRLIATMKDDIGDKLSDHETTVKIYNLNHLVICAVKLDIIQVIVRHKDF